MANNKIFIDKEVLLDVIQSDRTYHRSSSELFLVYAEDKRSSVYTSSDILKEVIDELQQQHDIHDVMELTKKILYSLHVLEYGASELKAASDLIDQKVTDNFSTALRYTILKNNRCSAIMTTDNFYYQTNNLRIINPIKLIDRH
jgi:predicted nucleic acid-binding protein